MRTPHANVGDVLRWAEWGAVRVAGAGIILCFVAVSIYVLWTLDRGFTLTDEAYYLLLATQPEASQSVYQRAALDHLRGCGRSLEAFLRFAQSVC